MTALNVKNLSSIANRISGDLKFNFEDHISSIYIYIYIYELFVGWFAGDPQK
jgi:hypothetical protein